MSTARADWHCLNPTRRPVSSPKICRFWDGAERCLAGAQAVCFASRLKRREQGFRYTRLMLQSVGPSKRFSSPGSGTSPGWTSERSVEVRYKPYTFAWDYTPLRVIRQKNRGPRLSSLVSAVAIVR